MSDEMENDSNFKEAIIKVIAFFDMFDYPLTLNEIWRMLAIKCDLIEVMEVLENEKAGKINLDCSSVPASVLKNKTECLRGNDKEESGNDKKEERQKIESKNGFYFLAGRGVATEERLKRYNFTDRKFKRAILVSKIFRFIPWIKIIAVSNLLGAHNLKDSSDIDFFIVTENKRIWLTRFFCAGLTKLTGLRPRADNSRDKICLSFYVSEGAMDLSELMLKQKNLDSRLRGNDKEESGNGKEDDDIYFIYWLAGLTPIYEKDKGAYEKFIRANGRLKEFFPNWQIGLASNRRRVEKIRFDFYYDMADLFFGGLEPQLKKFQLKILPAGLKKIMNQGTNVIVSDSILKLHINDRREEYREKFQKKIKL